MVKKDFFKKKIRADKFIQKLREEESPEFLKILKKGVKRDRNERFEKPVVG